MPENEIGLFEAMYTQRAIRSFKSDPVPRETINKIIEAATKAPSGGNTQPWAFIVIDDKEKISQIAKLAREQFAGMYEMVLKRSQPGDPPPFPRLKPMIDNFDSIPVLVYPCMVTPPGMPAGGPGVQSSVIPAVQNLLLAARGLGIGAAYTNVSLGAKAELQELLGIPDNVEPLAMIPMGYPDKERYGKTTRRPVSEVTHFNGWEGDKTNSATPTHR